MTETAGTWEDGEVGTREGRNDVTETAGTWEDGEVGTRGEEDWCDGDGWDLGGL